MVGKRVAERMRERGITQTVLARRVGVSQQAIGRLIRGLSRSSTHLHKIARELGTTAAYLAGETDDPEADAPAMSQYQRELLECFGRLDADVQNSLLATIRVLSGKHEPPARTVHASPVGHRPERG